MLGLVFALAVLAPTDQTVQVAKSTKLDVNNFAGDVIVKVWDRDAVRVEVDHSDRETIDIRQEDQVLHVRGRSVRGGPPRALDYTVTVPSWMSISVAGTYADVTMEGVGGEVNVETTRGDIKVSGGSGFVSLKSVQGEIDLQKAKGRIEVRAVNEGIRLAEISGDLSAETTNGSIMLDRIDSANVDLYTVNGSISYDGPIRDKGVYRLTTHNGMISMPVPDRVNATLMLRTYSGAIRSSFQLPADDSQRANKRRTLTLGNGSAHVELESFGGTIALRRPGEPRPEVERQRRRDQDYKYKEKNKDKKDQPLEPADAIAGSLEDLDASIDQAIETALREAEPAVEAAVEQATEYVNAVVGLAPQPAPAPRPAPRRR